MEGELLFTSLSSSSGRPSPTLELQLRSGTVNLQTLTITTRDMTIGGTYRAPCAAIGETHLFSSHSCHPHCYTTELKDAISARDHIERSTIALHDYGQAATWDDDKKVSKACISSKQFCTYERALTAPKPDQLSDYVGLNYSQYTTCVRLRLRGWIQVRALLMAAVVVMGGGGWWL